MPIPLVSVIIPTYNRQQFLRQTLESLVNQSWPSSRLEVIVVDDGSKDAGLLLPEEKYPFQCRVIQQSNQGSAAARNRGAEASQGDILIFIDDDIRLGSKYIYGIVEEHLAYPHAIGMGTLYTYSLQPYSVFSRTYSKYINPHTTGVHSQTVAFTECTTNNLSVERNDFFQIGMMQDIAGDGPTWWGDIDFGYRALQAGYQFRRSSKAVCFHIDYSIRDLKTYCQRNQKAAQIAVLLFQKHPELQSCLAMFLDKTPISLRDDHPRLILHKAWHQFQALKPVQKSMETTVRLLESAAPYPGLLWPFYRWITSSYIYQGYRAGLSKYGPVKSQV